MTNLTMYRGDDRELTISATEDLTGSTIRFTARRMDGTSEAVIEKASGDGIVLGDPATTAVVSIDTADTSSLRPTVLHWDIEVTDATDKIHTVADGTLTIKGDITYEDGS